MSKLRNIYSKEEAISQVQSESFSRRTVSFYRYVGIKNPQAMRDELYIAWKALGVLGRVYVAREGINAQISVPEPVWDFFVAHLDSFKEFKKMLFKFALEEPDISFWKLTIKVKEKIVAHGLSPKQYNITNTGKHLSAEKWNKLMEDPDALVLDMRNHYESEVGRFVGAITPDADTFKEEVEQVDLMLKDKKDKKIMMYCTGGVRCEPISAYLKAQGFEHVYQLNGGIIHYMQEVREQNLEPKFKGKNFVFDGRVGERATEDIISLCHQCDVLCDTHTNCKNEACHLLFIQCDACAEKYEGCCTPECQKICALPIEEQMVLRRGYHIQDDNKAVYKSRLRPNLKEVLNKTAV
ncbi:MAG: rhodanese-related sulfurtransferase [Patescibacteria group bacterium]